MSNVRTGASYNKTVNVTYPYFANTMLLGTNITGKKTTWEVPTTLPLHVWTTLVRNFLVFT